MSGGGEVRVLRQEPGQESPRMPAWKREILERRKAKGGGGSGGAEPPPQRVNGEVSGSVNGSSGGGGGGGNRDGGATGGATGGSGRNYTITTASQHFTHNKEPRAEKTPPRPGGRHENLVLQESLGPLEENPFIKLEKERRRRQDRENAARPVQHILELYGSVPGIRTIRAENIIIIESDPDYFPDAGGGKTGASWQQNGVDSYSSLNDLLDRRGSAVTEIRAKEVVIYDTTLSKSEENLSTLGRPDHEVSYDSGEGQGRVSRILQKFDSNYGKLQKKSHSTENLLELDCGASSRPRPWPKPQPDLVPKPRPSLSGSSPGSSQPPSPLFQAPWSSKPKPQPAVPELSSPKCHFGSPQSVFSFRQRFEESGIPRDEPDRGQNKPAREREWEVAEALPKPKVPCSPETRRVRAESPSSPISSKVPRSSQDYEIRPSPKPDLSKIPDGDTQAQALANLRLQSKNSFTVIPKRHLPGSPGPVTSSPPNRAPEVPTPGVPTSHMPALTPAPTTMREKLQEEVKEPEASPTVATSPPLTSEPLSPTPVLTPVSPSFLASPPSSPLTSPVPTDFSSPAPQQLSADQLPVTNIDEVEVEPTKRVPVPSPLVQRKKGNTFTVVPKRRVEPNAQPSSPESHQEASSEAQPGATPPQAPYAHLGTLLKKRYPAVEEIEVVGGYLTLEKSCLSKTGSAGKKLQISFNESSLQSTYEYPSESSVWDSGEEDEEEKPDAALTDEQPSMVGRIHIPRPSFTVSPSHDSNDLSSYIPKHSVDFSTWQEQKHDDGVYQEETSTQQTQEDVMLTPADSSSLSDYSSEPALYF
ncbi:taperin [Odontesthes bonariensis]|uniref:taperin n=1 Tax=Odontesthes bonariensis TaxID=219752 RepID=UPI003F58EDA7